MVNDYRKFWEDKNSKQPCLGYNIMEEKLKELKANIITHPEFHQMLPLDEVTFKWDKVQGKWETFADSQGINYKKLFDSLEKNGMLHPVMVRKMNEGYRKWQAGGRRIIWAKLKGYTHISAYVLTKQEEVDEIYTVQYDKTYK